MQEINKKRKLQKDQKLGVAMKISKNTLTYIILVVSKRFMLGLLKYKT